MTRIFYSTLYAVTLAAACAIWSRHEENPALRDLIGVKRANAQSPDPGNPLANDPANNPLMAPGGMGTGMNVPGGNIPGYQGVANMNQMMTVPQTVGKPAERPESWPSTSPIKPAAPPPPAVGPDGLPGVSISSIPVIPGMGETYEYRPNSPDANRPEATDAGRMAFGQSGAGPISPSQAAMAASSWSMARELEGTKILARVGTEYILAADVLGPVNDILAREASRIPPEQYEAIREKLIRQRLDSLILTKMVLDEARRIIPEEGYKKFAEKVGEQFDKVEVPRALVKSKLKTAKDLDEDLRKTGSSLEREKRAFIERQISQSWIHQQAKSDDEVNREEMLKYYRAHETQYDYPAKVRWEQIQVRFDRCPKAQAYHKLALAGNQIFDGAPFAEVAKKVSQGPTAATGGVHDWTTKGSLASEDVDRALFALPPGQLSPILEDARSFQIVRVIERKEAGRTPFTEAQAEIRKQIKQERFMAAVDKYVNELRTHVKVWTIYDEQEPDDLRPLKKKPVQQQPDSASSNVKAIAQAPPTQPPAGPPPADSAAPPGAPVGPVSGSPTSYPETAASYPAPPIGYPSVGGGLPAYPTTNVPAGAAYPAAGSGPPPSYPTTGALPGAAPPAGTQYR